MKGLLIVIQGPTASGKTNVAIALAKQFNAEIISCDSRQFFKELKIGAAPPSKDELAAVQHHFVQHLHVTESYNAGTFERDALAKLAELFAKNGCTILVGGSGLYADAVLKGFDDLPKASEAIRETLQLQLETEGITSLQAELEKADPVYFAEADTENPRRLIRALEVIRQTGKTFTEMRVQNTKARNFETISFVMDLPRELLYERINQRVESMMDAGLFEEAKSLLPFEHLQPLNTVGYKELFAHFKGEISLEEAVNLIKQNSRRFAKRQITWLRRDKNNIWIQPEKLDEMKDLVLEKRKNSNNLSQ